MSDLRSRDLLKVNFDIVSIFLDYSDWYDALGKVFSRVADCVDVDRIYYFENHRDLFSGEDFTSRRYEWMKQGVDPMVDNPELQNVFAISKKTIEGQCGKIWAESLPGEKTTFYFTIPGK